MTYGPRRNPRVSPNYIDNLKDLACECQLVFDRFRGGQVNDPVLPKHPEAGNRSARMHRKTGMPDLTPSPVSAPVRIDLATFLDEQFATLDEAKVGLHLVETDPEENSDPKFEEWVSSLGDVDGRSRAIVAYRRNQYEAGPQTSAIGLVVDGTWKAMRSATR